MKIYLIYTQKHLISKSVFTSIPDYYRLSEDKDVILYAYTDKKKFKDIFLKERKNIFFVKELKINKLEYETYEKDLRKYKLTYYTFHNLNEKVNILCAMFEHVQVHEYWFDDFFSENELSFLGMDIICSLKNKYITALRDLGLNSLIFIYDDEHGERDTFHEIEYSDDYSSVYITHEPSSSNNKDIYRSFNMKLKDINLFIHKYKELFK